jgi:membrane protein implicated in regulation of membrane protease activity
VNWLDFYLICFAIGGGFSLMGLLAGHVHAPHVHLHHGGGHLGGAFNMGTISAFLLWFGAAGYVVTRFETWWFIWGLLLSAFLGLVGASMVFWFIARVLMHGDVPLDQADYDMIGVLGRVTCTVRQGGTGEMIFSQQGRRSATPIRSEDGCAIAKGAEVIVTRYERGIAYVRGFDELDREESAAS